MFTTVNWYFLLCYNYITYNYIKVLYSAKYIPGN